VLRQTVPHVCGGDRKSSVDDGLQMRTADDQLWRWRWTKATSWAEIRRRAEFISKVRGCCSM